LTKITIPKGANRDDLIKLVEKKGYSVDHENKKISRTVGGKTETVTLKEAEIIGKPKEKTALQKQKAAEKKEEKAVVQKKKERELKKEAVKKATKDMVPKTKPPQKIGAKPVPQKKEKKKFPTEGAKKVGEAIKKRKEEAAKKKAQAKAPAPTPKTTVAKKPRRQLKETKKPTGSDVVQPGMPKDVKIEEKKKKEKKKFPTEGAKKIGEAIKAKAEAKKKAKEEKPEKAKKIRKGTVREKKSFATLKDSWSTGAKLTFKWSPEQVKQIEDILNNRDGIEGQGYEQKESGTKWVFHFTKDGKQEKLMIKRPDPKPFKEIKELKEKAKNAKKGEPRMKGGLISMIMESEGEAKTILENILKKYNSLTEEQKEKNRLALDNKLFDRVINFQRVNSSGNIIGGGIKALKEVQKAIDEMGSKKADPNKGEPDITQLKGFKVLEKVYQKGYAKRIKLRKKYLEGGFKNEMDWEMADEDEDDEMRSKWMASSIPQDDIKFLFLKSPYNDKASVLQKVDGMLEKRVENYKTWLNLMKKGPKN
jgi:hypothetical protein